MNIFSGRVSWEEHWTNGGTGLTRSASAEISRSVILFGDASIFMKGSDLHTIRKPANVSDFWSFHNNRIKK